jgi:hypothetical protein
MAKSIFDRLNPSEPSAPRHALSPAVLSYNAPRALTASAVRIDLKNKKEVDAITKRRVQDKWQQEAWEYYDLIGEIKYVANLIASVTSRVNLYIGYVEKSANVPSDIEDVEKLDPDFVQNAEDILYLLESGNGGTAGLLRSAALNLFITGECWLVNEPARFSTNEPSKYQIRSIEEITVTAGRNATVAIKPRRDAKPADFIPLPSNGFASRIWRNHPRFSDEADSSLRGVLDVCDQLLIMDRAASASAKSRMNAGLLFVPDGLSNVTQVEGEMSPEGIPQEVTDMDESFEEELIAGLIAPVEDISSAASLVPTVIRGPDELGDKIRHITFERSVDQHHELRSDRLLDRILSGLDVPKDVAAGMSNVKYANAIVIEEQLYKAHIEPLILLIADCLTIGFLRPALRKQGWDEDIVNRAVVWYDPSEITAKPSRAEASVTLYDKKIIGAEAVLRANGFTPADAPTDLERVQRMAEERAILSDAMSETLLNTIIPQDIQDKSREQALAQSDPASANALQTAIGGDPAAEAGAPAGPEAPAGSDTIEPTTSNEQAPPTLMEP